MDTTSVTTRSVIEDIERSQDDATTRPGTTTTTTTTTSTQEFDRVVAIDIIPQIRQRWIAVSVDNLRPSTDYFHATWDSNNGLDELGIEIDFNDFVNSRGEPQGLTENWDQYKGSTSTNAATAQIIQFVKSDSNGEAKFAVRVPAGVSFGADSIVELVNEADVYAGIGGLQSRANAVYKAFGLTQEIDTTIISTQVIDIRDSQNPPVPPQPPPVTPPPVVLLPNCGDRITQAELIALGGERAILRELNSASQIVFLRPDLSVDPPEFVISCAPRTSIDPLAQSFKTYNAATYISSIDIYFKTKPQTTGGAAVTLQIREMINGFPGPRIIPGSTLTINPQDITTSIDSSVATRFKFMDPVYLEANTNYCFVVLAFSTEYSVWTSELGQPDILTGNVIDRQPVIGSLFTSQNNVTWTPNQNHDMKFNINSCNFSSDGSNEFIDFLPMTGADAFTTIQRTSQMVLGNNQIIHPGTDIKWFYKFDQVSSGPTFESQGLTPEFRPFNPGTNLDLQNLTSQVILRLQFTGGTLTPVIDRERAGIVFLKNLTNGSYITRTAEHTSINPENLRPNRIRGLFIFKAPTNTTLTVYFAINDDIENESDIQWRKVVDITSSGGAVESGQTTFVVDTGTDQLVLAEPIGFFTGQAVTFDNLTGAAELVGTKYVRVTSSTILKVYNSQSNAENDISAITISAGSGDIIRSTFARYNQSVLPGGWTEAQFDYDFNGILPLFQTEGINQYKCKIELAVEEGFQALTPLVRSLRLIANRR